MDDLSRQYPYPRYLTVPFIFVPDGNTNPTELEQFKRDYPGWVMFRATFTPTAPPDWEASPKDWADTGRDVISPQVVQTKVDDTTPLQARQGIEALDPEQLRGMALILSAMTLDERVSLLRTEKRYRLIDASTPESNAGSLQPDISWAEPYRRIGEALFGQAPPPRPRSPPPVMPPAEAQARFVAACWAAHDTATGASNADAAATWAQTSLTGDAEHDVRLAEAAESEMSGEPRTIMESDVPLPAQAARPTWTRQRQGAGRISSRLRRWRPFRRLLRRQDRHQRRFGPGAT